MSNLECGKIIEYRSRKYQLHVVPRSYTQLLGNRQVSMVLKLIVYSLSLPCLVSTMLTVHLDLNSISNTRSPKDVAPFHLLAISKNQNGFEM